MPFLLRRAVRHLARFHERSIIMAADPIPQNHTNDKAAYRVVVADLDRDEQSIQQLWRDGGLGLPDGASADADRFNWFYRTNPAGQAQAYLLVHSGEGQAVGTMGIGVRHFSVAGEEARGGTLVDFVVSPKHRSAYPALTLQRQGRQLAFESKDFLYGLPDTKAVIICRRLESHVQFDLPRFVRVIRTRFYLERKLPSWLAGAIGAALDSIDALLTSYQRLPRSVQGQWVDEFDARFDRLWERLDKHQTCLGVRDWAFLRWRFTAQPGHRYRIFAITDARTHELVSYFVCEQGRSALAVKDCLSLASANELKRHLLLLCRAARAGGAASLEIQLSPNATWREALSAVRFIQRSQRPFFATLSEAVQVSGKDLHWYITQADEDV